MFADALVVVVKHHTGWIEVLGASPVFLDESALLRKGAVLYQVVTEDGNEIYEKLHPAAVAWLYARLRGQVAYLEALDREGRVVHRL